MRVDEAFRGQTVGTEVDACGYYVYIGGRYRAGHPGDLARSARAGFRAEDPSAAIGFDQHHCVSHRRPRVGDRVHGAGTG
jgi:hypothetical protein